MRFVYILFLGYTICTLSIGCKQSPPSVPQEKVDYNTAVKKLTDMIVHDIFSPPVASRIYAYSSIAGYEAARYLDSSYHTLSDQISHMPAMPKPDSNKKYDFELANKLAFLKVGKVLIFSEDSIQIVIDQIVNANKGVMDKEELKNSISFADSISKQVLLWSKKDNYAQTRSSTKHQIQKMAAAWKPTPPSFMESIEPSWNRIQSFTLDSAGQFKPAPPTPFDVENKNSLFYKETMEVYNTGNSLTEEQNEIANFWDCNPYKMNVTGHIMHATKKITPGGHWINIVGVISNVTKASFVKNSAAYALASIALADAFISCWDEKYRSNLIRPETVINKYIDPEWRPLLQTPPFPEYTSGHSVASLSAATVLTDFFGDGIAFDDYTEVEFGLPVRSFKSINEAADEAAISRLYGGIHYRPAIENGMTQGKDIGNWVLSKIKFTDLK